MTKMAAMPIYGKNPSKIFFSGTGAPISKKLGVKHLWLKYYNVYINHDPVMTLTQFMDRILIILKKKEENGPRASSAPALPSGVKYHNIQTCLLVYATDLR